MVGNVLPSTRHQSNAAERLKTFGMLHREARAVEAACAKERSSESRTVVQERRWAGEKKKVRVREARDVGVSREQASSRQFGSRPHQAIRWTIERKKERRIVYRTACIGSLQIQESANTTAARTDGDLLLPLCSRSSGQLTTHSADAAQPCALRS